MTRFALIVPCYNEQDSLNLLVKRFYEVKGTVDAKLILVNNGSTDRSAQIMKKLAQKAAVDVVHLKHNKGYGNGIWKGLEAAKAEYVGWTHADLQTDLKDAFRALAIAEQSQGYVKGRRIHRPFIDTLFTTAMSVFESVLFGMHLVDINAQPNVFKSSFLKALQNPPQDFSFDLYCYVMAHKKGLPIRRFAVIFGKRAYGTSHWNTSLGAKWKFIKRTVKFSVQLKRRLHAQNYSSR